MRITWLLGVALSASLWGGLTKADVFTVDENGTMNGNPAAGFLRNDPGPGGLPQVLTYTLPFDGTAGDIILREGSLTGPFTDLLRFDGAGRLIVYSEIGVLDKDVGDKGLPAIGTDGLPLHQGNVQQRVETVRADGSNGLFSYTPNPGDPGFNALNIPTYNFISDAAIPEPGVLHLLGVAASGWLGYSLCRRGRRSS